MARNKDTQWSVEGTSFAECQLCLLMDIRDELKQLNEQVRTSLFCHVRHDVSRLRSTAQRIDKRLSKKIPLK